MSADTSPAKSQALTGHWFRHAPVVAAAWSAVLGITVLFGWYVHSERLVQVHPSFVPMQFNTALGFLLSAAWA